MINSAFLVSQPSFGANVAAVHPNSDLGNARRLVDRHGNDIRFVSDWSKWMVWNSTCWVVDDDGAVMRLAKETVESMFQQAMFASTEAEKKELRSHALKSQSEARLKSMVELAKTEAAVVLKAQELDANPWLLGVRNGLVELRTGCHRPAQRNDFITKHADAVFDGTAGCPNWLAFLDTVTGGDVDLQAYLQRAIGYAFTGSVQEEVLFVLYGTGCNGKSTFRETIHALLGDYALAADASVLTERKNNGSATEEVARLQGRRFVAVNETSENDQLHEARIKFITSQDTITARPLYGHLFDFFPTHKTFLTTNHKPIVRGTDEGIWRRVHLIPFTVTIDKTTIEKNFRERRLMPELPGILNWAIQGIALYQKEGLNPPEIVRQSTQEYRQDMDVVGQWIADRCDVDATASIPSGSAYIDYSQWAREEVGWELGKLKFRRHLIDRGFEAAKGAHGQRMIKGLRLKSDYPVPEAANDVGEKTQAVEELDARIAELLRSPDRLPA
jgi:putative DNA primase/helicase